jgi:hypothetical protein
MTDCGRPRASAPRGTRSCLLLSRRGIDSGTRKLTGLPVWLSLALSAVAACVKVLLLLWHTVETD